MNRCDFCLDTFGHLYEYKPTFVLWLTCDDCFGDDEQKYLDKYYGQEVS